MLVCQVARGEQPILLQLPPSQRPAVQVPLAKESLTPDSGFVLDHGATP